MKNLFIALAAVALALPSLASAATWNIDGSHSSVDFKIRHFFTKVPGKFNTVTGEIQFDPAAVEKGSVMVTIPVESVDTNNEKRDGHLKSPDFFDAANHPEITFKSTKFHKEGDTIKVDGLLNMRGVEKPVTLDVEFLGAGPDAWGGTRAGFEATTKLNRKDWNIEWNTVLDNGGTVLGDEVEISLAIEAIQAK
ncbi:MAG: polyisoprenoid-binding protein [Candidatus Eisenbacteria bacterium]|uniref:Polyisoprenoid-binding protein n=1 Tax=Eiseniibacteriota bacterium TaxID=2212470 RepID=A0A956NC04_UNCEI|nr:polyisoprenoid-binding protein [Candidatus Eisenbacteria bacterium]MCB9464099.1 polyisoprenoid-binding protein [Candidatus Eisenbacteria bacterium]